MGTQRLVLLAAKAMGAGIGAAPGAGPGPPNSPIPAPAMNAFKEADRAWRSTKPVLSSRKASRAVEFFCFFDFLSRLRSQAISSAMRGSVDVVVMIHPPRLSESNPPGIHGASAATRQIGSLTRSDHLAMSALRFAL